MNKEEFIEYMAPMATAAINYALILPSVTIAQACLESAYGTSDLAVNAHNVFGMKAELSGNTWPSAWDGTSIYTKKSPEQDEQGNTTYLESDFRRYPDVQQSVIDHTLYLAGAMKDSEPRYKGLVGELSYRKAAQIIKDGGYATDINYVDKICSIIETYDLTLYDVFGIGAGNKMTKICIDAGHYGKYNQSPCNSAYYESDMVWKLHLLLKKHLEEYNGVEIITTRPNQETDRVLYDRGAASKGCNLFISLHSNATASAKRESIDYPAAYCAINHSADEIGLKLAKCVEMVMQTQQEGHIENVPGKNGDYYGVVRGATAVGTPGLILEHSFHTNSRSTAWLMDDGNLERLAEAEAAVIAEHYGLTKKQTSYIPGWYSDDIGWWYRNEDGSYPAGTWAWLHEATGDTWAWYLFDERGYMLKGAHRAPDGRLFYLCEDPGINEGKCMVTDDQGALQIAEYDTVAKRYLI